jgi:four helix bundle protein
VQDYKKLKVFHEAHSHVLKVRKATNRFPRTGYSSLKLQLTRATESISFNIVEGCGSATQKEFARYLDISIKSSNETEYQLNLAYDYGVLSSDDWEPLANKTVQIRKMLCKLRAKVDGDEDCG